MEHVLDTTCIQYSISDFIFYEDEPAGQEAELNDV